MLVLKKIENYTDEKKNRIYTQSSGDCAGVAFYGQNNTLEIGENVNITHLSIYFFMDNAKIHIKSGSKIRLYAAIGNDAYIEVGSGCTSANNVSVYTSEGGKVIIGEDCMFSSNITLRACDGHAIYSTVTHKRMNMTKDIILGDHVWVGFDAVILGGSVVGSGSIVGYNATVTKCFPNNCIIGGNPAKILRRHAAWARPHKTRLGFAEYSERALLRKNESHWNLTRENLTRLQKLIVRSYSSVVQFIHEQKDIDLYNKDPQLFFIHTSHPLSRFVRNILNKSGAPIF